jgi:HSP90 family molecular chaperone
LKEFIDSVDFPLEIFHEQFKKNHIIEPIRKNIINKTLELFSSISENNEDLKTLY